MRLGEHDRPDELEGLRCERLKLTRTVALCERAASQGRWWCWSLTKVEGPSNRKRPLAYIIEEARWTHDDRNM